jgi:hypothetical protein
VRDDMFIKLTTNQGKHQYIRPEDIREMLVGASGTELSNYNLGGSLIGYFRETPEQILGLINGEGREPGE